jgi:segregation and condensation protein B
MNLEQQLEAILFFKGEPVTISFLSKCIGKKEEEIREGLDSLENSLEQRGITLMRKDQEVTLATHRDVSHLIEAVKKDQLTKDIGRAGFETLAIVLYKGPISRSDIDYIRGVNSTFILRNLLIRGLIERVSNPKDTRSFLYKPTFEILSHIGVSDIKELPDFDAVQQELQSHIDEPVTDGSSDIT